MVDVLMLSVQSILNNVLCGTTTNYGLWFEDLKGNVATPSQTYSVKSEYDLCTNPKTDIRYSINISLLSKKVFCFLFFKFQKVLMPCFLG